MSEPEVGKIYQVNHRRKGTFKVRVLAVSEGWVDCEIVDGQAYFVSDSNRGEGEKITLGQSLSRFHEIEPPAEANEHPTGEPVK